MSDKNFDDLRKSVISENFDQGGLKPGLAISEMEEKIATDQLMKIASRRKLEERMKEIEKRNIHASVLFMDLDKFKEVNDNFGHGAGDEVLSVLGKRLNTHISHSRGDIVGRWGGEEFLVILSGLESKETLFQRAEDLRKMIEREPFGLDEKNLLHKTISIGAAKRKNGEAWEKWLERADNALYQAKESGRNKVVVAE